MGRHNIFFLHGKKRAQTNSIDSWIAWAAEKCRELGYLPVAELMQNSWKSYGNDWLAFIDTYAENFSEEMIFVGHSAGAAAIVRWLGENSSQKIKKLILVAPCKIAAQPIEKMISTQTGELLPPEDYEPIKDLYDFAIDVSIKDRVRDGIYVITSNDSQRLLDSADMYIEALDAKHIVLYNRGHFNEQYGAINQTLPEVVDIIGGE